jgi:hypothetical protein
MMDLIGLLTGTETSGKQISDYGAYVRFYMWAKYMEMQLN